MTTKECVESLNVILGCVDDKLQGERDNMTKLINLKPSSFEIVLLQVIERLEQMDDARMDGGNDNEI